MKRPLGIVAVLYAFGILLGNYLPLPLSCLAIISVVLLAGAIFAPRLRLHLARLLFIFLGWMNFTWHTAITFQPTCAQCLATNLNLSPSAAPSPKHPNNESTSPTKVNPSEPLPV